MLYVLTLAGVTAIAVIAAHLTWRKNYGINLPFWARVEIAWWVLSFLSVAFAAAQFEDKSRSLEKEPILAVLPERWHNARTYTNFVVKELTSDSLRETISHTYGSNVYDALLTAVSSTQRFINRDALDVLGLTYHPRDIYTGRLQVLCSHPVGSKLFSETYPRRWEFDAPGDDSGFAGTAALACTYAYLVKMNVVRLKEIDDEHESLRLVYTVTRYWYFLLLAGFALKFTKNTHELVRARQQRIAGLPASPAHNC